MTTLTILRGISGSGKSTWTRQQNAAVVSRDDLRETFFPNFTPEEYYKSPVLRDMEESITRVQDVTVKVHLERGDDVVVDNTNVEWRYVEALAKIGYRCGAEVEVKVFDVDVQVAIMNDLNRRDAGGRYVGADIIKKQHARLKDSKHKTLSDS